MLSMMRKIFMVAIVGSTAMLMAPDTVDAQRRGDRDGRRGARNDRDDRGDRDRDGRRGRHDRRGRYWNRYWNWYDNDYRPYWHRRNRARRFNDFGYRYGRNYRYYSPYFGRYRNSIQVGPLRFGWR